MRCRWISDERAAACCLSPGHAGDHCVHISWKLAPTPRTRITSSGQLIACDRLAEQDGVSD